MSSSKGTVVLAYSGGLDTSCILRWLIEEGYEVVAYMANVGQTEDFEEVRKKALKIGAKEVVIEDLRREFLSSYVWPAIAAGLLYEGRYLLGTSLARPCIARGLAAAAHAHRAAFCAHGATGKGNDQVRLELALHALSPDMEMLAPWRLPAFTERFQGRSDLIRFAKERNIPVPVTPSQPWSMDANLMHVSYESGVLEDPAQPAPEELFQMTCSPFAAPDRPCVLCILFEQGEPAGLKVEQDPEGEAGSEADTERDLLRLFERLNQLAGRHGVGRIDIVENRFIGLKSRGVYETPAGTVLHAAHQDLETHCLDREVLRLVSALRERLADYVYNGFWFSPEGKLARRWMAQAQEPVTGWVRLQLFKSAVRVLARAAPNSPYSQELSSMDQHGGVRPADATGFIRTHALRLRGYEAAPH